MSLALLERMSEKAIPKARPALPSKRHDKLQSCTLIHRSCRFIPSVCMGSLLIKSMGLGIFQLPVFQLPSFQDVVSYSAVLTALERSEAWEAAVQLLEALRFVFWVSESVTLQTSVSFFRSMETHLSASRLNVSESPF